MMAGGDFIQYETSKELVNSNYECNLKHGDELDDIEDSKNIQHINPAIYIESFHDMESDEIKESDYLLDLMTLEPSTSRTTCLSSSRSSFSNDTCSYRNESHDVRYINSAIFIERVDGNSCDDSTYRKPDIKQSSKMCLNKLNGTSLASIPVVKSASNYGKNLKSKSSVQAKSYVTEDESRQTRGLSFDEWLASKQQLNRPKKGTPEKTNKNEEDGRKRRVDEQREDFKRWLAIKREKEKMKKKELEMQKAKVKEDEEYKLQRSSEKDCMLKSWIKLKDEQLKNKKRREEMQKKKQEEEKKMRQELSAKSFQDWKERSKYKPKPVPLNMGVESLRGSISSIQFINPTPWQENIDLRQSSA